MSGDNGKVVAGVFIGIVLGIAAAGGVAWYVMKKNPSEFTNKEQAKPAPQVAPLAASAPAVTAPIAASGVGDTKQHFEFYKTLTDKSDGTAHKSATKPAPKPKEPAHAPAAKAPTVTAPAAAVSKEKFIVQAGSFQNKNDAESLKANLVLKGFEANIQSADIPGKGVWYRVRLGPYGESEASKTITTLKQSGITATQMHAQ